MGEPMKTSILMTMVLTASRLAHATPADLAQMRTSDFLMGTAETGCQPKGLRSDARGEYAYVAEMCGKKIDGKRVATVSIFNIKTMRLEKTVITPSGPTTGILGNTEVNFTLDQDYVLAARAEGPRDATAVYPGQGMITVIDTESKRIKEFIPLKGTGSKIIEMRPYVHAEGNRQIVYVANYFSDDISILDVTGMGNDSALKNDARNIGKIKLYSAFANPRSHFSAIAPRGISFTPDGRYALVDASTTGSIFIVDSVSHKQIAELAPIPDSVGAVPLRQQVNGKSMNVRHIVMTKDGSMVYLSHMRGDAVSRISVSKLIAAAKESAANGQGVLPASVWPSLLIPFANGKSLIKVPHYPKDQPPLYTADGRTISVAGKDWDLARPNTIVLDPSNERYLYVSCRTDTDPDYNKFNTKTRGKVDIIDTHTGEVIFTLVGGSQPTALEITPDNGTLISGGFKDATLYFFDMKKLISIYEN